MARLMRDVADGGAAVTVPAHGREVALAARLAEVEAELMEARGQLTALQQEAEQRRKTVEVEAHAEGYRAGVAQAEAEMAGRLQQMGALLQALAEHRHAVMTALEDEVVALSYEATMQIVADLATTADGVRGMVQQVLSRAAAKASALHLRVAPADHALLLPHIDSLRATAPGVSLSLVADPSIDLGGCVVDTDHGSLDGRLQFQFERLRDVWLAARAVEPVE